MKSNEYNINHNCYSVDKNNKVIASYKNLDKNFYEDEGSDGIVRNIVLPIILSILIIANINVLAKRLGFNVTNGYLCLILMYVLCMFFRQGNKEESNDIFRNIMLPIILSIVLIININVLAKRFGFNVTNGYLCLILMYILCIFVRQGDE